MPPATDARHLTRWHAAALVAGSMVGVGIFLTPRIVAEAAGTGPLFFAIWGLGALVALAGALSVAELGAMLPEAGGDYVYLRTAYGDFAGFLYGWLSLLASFSGAIAAMAVGIPRYQGPLLFGEGVHDVVLQVGTFTVQVDQLAALGIVWALTVLACLRVRVTGRVQLTLTAAVLAILLGGSLWALAGAPTAAVPHPPTAAERGDWRHVILAFAAVYFSYTGWNTATYVAAELHEPRRDLPWALVAATTTVGAVYLLMCAAFVHALPDLRQAYEAGSATAVQLFGPAGGVGMAVVIAAAVLSSVLASIVAGSRIYFAMGRDGLFFRAVGQLAPRLGTPMRSLVLQGAWVSVLVLSGTFEDLLRWSALTIMVLSIATVLAVPVLRWRQPQSERPFRAWGYPWTTVLYVVPCATVVAANGVERPGEAATAAACIVVGWVAWRLRSRPMAG